jgi:hypothetical protein
MIGPALDGIGTPSVRPSVRRLFRRALVVAIGLGASLAASPIAAQSVLKGRVVADSTRVPLGGAEVAIPSLGLGTRTDSLGAFRLPGISVGAHAVVVRHTGFAERTERLSMVAGDSLVREFRLAPSPMVLEEVKVVGAEEPIVPAKLIPFHDRMKGKNGRFLTEADFSNASRNEEVLQKRVPGMRLVRGKGSVTWVASSRGMSTIQNLPPLDPFDVRQGASHRECYSAVLLDGAWAYRGHPREPLFNVNSIHPNMIAGMEFYAGSGTTPPEFRSMGAACGVLAIWLK